MRIENEIKLDFKDVLIRPKRSTLNTRNDVQLARPFAQFKHAQIELPEDAIPIFTANMDTTGTFEMAVAFVEENDNPFFVAMHKHYSIEDWEQFATTYPNVLPYVAMSAGTRKEDFEKIVQIKEIVGEQVRMICLDIANGYSEHFVECVKKYRRTFPRHIIIAGNVVTGEMVEELILSGADIVKVGIGPGCFGENTKVLMSNGTYKKISEIIKGEYIIDKTGKSVEVLNIINKGIRKTVKLTTNNWYEETYVTPDHEYWMGDCSSCSKNTISSKGIAKILDKKSKTIPKQSKYKWKPIEDIDIDKMFTVYPNTCQWNCVDKFTIDLSDFSCSDKTKVNNEYIETNGSSNGIYFLFSVSKIYF